MAQRRMTFAQFCYRGRVLDSSFLQKICEDTYNALVSENASPEEIIVCNNNIIAFFRKVLKNGNLVVDNKQYAFKNYSKAMIIFDKLEHTLFKEEKAVFKFQNHNACKIGNHTMSTIEKN